MGYSKEVLTQARQALERQRADRESENAARQEQAYARLPRLREIDVALRSTMAKAALAAFTQGGDAQAALEQAKQENLALQAERKQLIETYFGGEDLEGKPLCDRCGGTGYVGSAMCQCLKALCVQFQRQALGAVFSGSESFENFCLEYYSGAVNPALKASPRWVMTKVLEHCRRYAREFSMGSGNLLITGGTGLGKTHLALSIGRAVGEQGFSVCYETAAGLFNKLEKAKFYANEETRAEADKIGSCDLLIIDDLGTELSGQFVTASLYELLNQRLMAGMPMVVTTNLLVDEMANRYSPQIASRFYGEFRRLACVGSDIRVLKNKPL